MNRPASRTNRPSIFLGRDNMPSAVDQIKALAGTLTSSAVGNSQTDQTEERNSLADARERIRAT